MSDVEQQEYAISADVWGKVGCTVKASSHDEALGIGERVLRANWQSQFELFPPDEEGALSIEAVLDVDTDFDIEAEVVEHADVESEIFRMAKAYVQEVHGLGPEQLSVNEWSRAIYVAQRMKDAVDE